MKYRVETITPDRAQRLLLKTEQLGFTNRGLRRYHIDKLAHAMSLGQWRVTHEALALNKEGGVLDGQHRLHAIVQSDVPVDMLVIRDAEPESFAVVNTGTARTTADSLKVAGYHDVNHLSAVVRGYIAYNQVIDTTNSYRNA